MPSVIASNLPLRALLAVAASAALFWFGNGLHPWWPLTWFAPLPALLFAAGSPSCKSAALVAFASLFLGSFAMWHYFQVMGALPGWFAVYTLVSTVFMGAALLFRALLRRGATWSALLGFPAAMVSCEYALSFTPGGSAGSLANTQLDFLPFLQLASITGPYGMTFVLLGFPAALAVAFHLRPTAPRRAGRILVVGLGTVALTLAFGAWRLSAPVSSHKIKVGLIASDTRDSVLVAEAGAETTRLFREYAAAARSLVLQGANTMVLPEKIGTVTEPDLPAADAIFQAVADDTQAILVAGMVHAHPTVKTNQARVYAPHQPVRSYDKHHLLPVFESATLQPGTSLTLLPQWKSAWGIAICKDLDHPDPARRYGQARTSLLLVPAWDFGVDGWWHGHIAVMRGVENGFGVVRAAKEGLLYASDPYGRILGETRSAAAPFATLLVDVPVEHIRTLYGVWGNWFAWVAVAMFLWTLFKVGTAVPSRP